MVYAVEVEYPRSAFSACISINPPFPSVATLKRLLNAAALVAEKLLQGHPTVVLSAPHPTSASASFPATIVSSLAQVFLDDRYRTKEGFTALFVKEWLPHVY